MLQPTIKTGLKFMSILTSAGMLFSACHNNDTSTDSSITTTSDTASVMHVDSSAMMRDTMGNTNMMQADTVATMSTTTPSTPAAGTGAKPNPAKKGLKGKVTVAPAPKMTGKMEMDNTGVYSNVEYLPSFPGGNKGLQSYFDKNLQYPEEASNEGVEGTVNVSFVVDENGKLTNPQIVGNNRLGYGLEDEALRVVRSMPTWTAGKLKGQNVKTRYTMPVRFVLY